MSRLHIIVLALVASLIACDKGLGLADVVALQEAGRYAESIEPLRALLRENPDDAELNFRLGTALLADKQFGMAVWPLRRAADSPAYAIRAGLELAWATHHNGTFDDAVNAATSVLEHEPENLSALLVRGRSHLRANREELALEDFNRIEEIDPDHADMWMSRAITLARLGRIEDAAEQIAAVRERVGEEAEFAAPIVCTLEAVFTYESGDVEGAQQAHEGCLRDHQDVAVVMHHAVKFYDETGRAERGTEILLEALARNPSLSGVRSQIATRLHSAGDVERAEEILQEGTTNDPGATPWISLALHFDALQQPARACDAMAMALERTPTLPPDLRFAYADMCIRAGEYDAALTQVRHLPWPGYAPMIRGRIAFEQGDYTTAYREFETAIESQPSNPGLRQLTGQAAEHLGRFNRAISHYREAIRTDEPGVQAGLDLALLQKALGNLPAAYTAAGIHQKLNPNDLEGYRVGLSLSERLGLTNATTSQAARLQAIAGQGEVVAIRAEILLEAGKPEDAAKVVRNANIDLAEPAQRSALRVLVRALFAADRDDQAQSLLAPLVRQSPTDAEMLAMSAQALERSDADAAQEAHTRALELDPTEPMALLGSARLAAQRGSTSEALAYNDRVLEIDAGHADAAWHAIEVSQTAGDVAEYTSRLKARLRAEPTDGAAALALAREVIESNPEESLQLATRAVRLGTGPEAAETLAEIHHTSGRPTDAVQVLEHVLTAHPDRSGTRYRLGLAHLAAGQRDAAIDAFKQSLAGAPFDDAEKAREQLAALSSDLQP